MSSRQHSRQRGSVFVVAIVAATGVIAFGLAIASVSEVHSQVTDVDLDRVRAQALAESGVEDAYRQFIDDRVSVGTYGPYGLAGGTVTYTISPSGPDYDVVSVGQYEDQFFTFSTRAQMTASVPGPADIQLTAYGGNTVWATSSNVTWSGELRYANPHGGWSGSTMTGSSSQGAVPSFAIDTGPYSTRAETVLPAGTSLNNATLDGVVYCPGNLTLSRSCNVTGLLVVDGDLYLDGKNQVGSIVATVEEAAILVRGNLEAWRYNQLTIDGAIFVEGKIEFGQSSSIEVNGSVYTNGILEFFQSAVTLTYDPTIQDNPPECLNGGPRQPGTGGALTELWRIPSRNAPGSTSGSGTEEPPADDPETTDTDNAPWGDSEEADPNQMQEMG